MSKEQTVINEKVFRIGDNARKIEFIKKFANIPESIIVKSAVVAKENPYHNFGHQLGATEDAILIALQENVSPEERYILAFTMLFHDAQHTGVMRVQDEMLAMITMFQVSSDTDFTASGFPLEKAKAMARDIGLATIFSNHRKSTNKLHQIAQDADLAHVGHGPYRWVWASMGLMDEFNRTRDTKLTPKEFLQKEQRKFIEFILSTSPDRQFWITEGATQILGNPADDLLFIESLSDEAIQYAYDARFKNIPLSEFKERIQELIGVPQ